jgi:hypothetical protein
MGITTRDWAAAWLRAQQSVRAAGAAGRRSRAAERVTGTRPSHALHDYAGTYHHPGYGDVTVRLDGERLAIEWAGFASPLTHWHYDVFQAATTDYTSPWAPAGYSSLIRFATDFSGRISALEIGGLTGVEDVVFGKTVPTAGR